jgi:hypothetical protein
MSEAAAKILQHITAGRGCMTMGGVVTRAEVALLERVPVTSPPTAPALKRPAAGSRPQQPRGCLVPTNFANFFRLLVTSNL